jgi:hypothetical protein
MAKHRLVREDCRRWLWAGTLALLAVVGARQGIAADDPSDAKQSAKARFTAGQKHYNLNEYPEALREFKEGYRLFSDPVFLFNLGQCERQLGHPDEAIRFYRSYLREQPKAANRAEVQRRIEEMEVLLKTKQAEAAPPIVPAENTAPPTEAPPPLAAPAPAPEPAAPAQPTATPAPLPPPVAQPLPTTPPVNSESTTANNPRVDLTQAPGPAPEAESSPIYKRWWFWTAAAAVVVGTGIGIYAATASNGPAIPSSGLGSKKVF